MVVVVARCRLSHKINNNICTENKYWNGKSLKISVFCVWRKSEWKRTKWRRRRRKKNSLQKSKHLQFFFCRLHVNGWVCFDGMRVCLHVALVVLAGCIRAKINSFATAAAFKHTQIPKWLNYAQQTEVIFLRFTCKHRVHDRRIARAHTRTELMCEATRFEKRKDEKKEVEYRTRDWIGWAPMLGYSNKCQRTK